jgi:hypothetical protein
MVSSSNPCWTSQPQILGKFSLGFSIPSTFGDRFEVGPAGRAQAEQAGEDPVQLNVVAVASVRPAVSVHVGLPYAVTFVPADAPDVATVGVAVTPGGDAE